MSEEGSSQEEMLAMREKARDKEREFYREQRELLREKIDKERQDIDEMKERRAKRKEELKEKERLWAEQEKVRRQREEEEHKKFEEQRRLKKVQRDAKKRQANPGFKQIQPAGKPIKIVKQAKKSKDDEVADRERALDERVEPLNFGLMQSEERFIQMAEQYQEKLRKAAGEIFELRMKSEKRGYEKMVDQKRLEVLLAAQARKQKKKKDVVGGIGASERLNKFKGMEGSS